MQQAPHPGRHCTAVSAVVIGVLLPLRLESKGVSILQPLGPQRGPAAQREGGARLLAGLQAGHFAQFQV